MSAPASTSPSTKPAATPSTPSSSPSSDTSEDYNNSSKKRKYLSTEWRSKYELIHRETSFKPEEAADGTLLKEMWKETVCEGEPGVKTTVVLEAKKDIEDPKDVMFVKLNYDGTYIGSVRVSADSLQYLLQPRFIRRPLILTLADIRKKSNMDHITKDFFITDAFDDTESDPWFKQLMHTLGAQVGQGFWRLKGDKEFFPPMDMDTEGLVKVAGDLYDKHVGKKRKRDLWEKKKQAKQAKLVKMAKKAIKPADPEVEDGELVDTEEKKKKAPAKKSKKAQKSASMGPPPPKKRLTRQASVAGAK
jgi:hypothetical protein